MTNVFVSLLVLIVGFILLMKGADFFVEGSSSIATRFHIPSLIIGLTIVAMGTSLPECAVSITASMEGNNALAVANAVGSNIFNVFLILGLSSTILPMNVTKTYLYDVGLLTIVSILVYIPILLRKKIGRVMGAVMTCSYIAYTAYLIMR